MTKDPKDCTCRKTLGKVGQERLISVKQDPNCKVHGDAKFENHSDREPKLPSEEVRELALQQTSGNYILRPHESQSREDISAWIWGILDYLDTKPWEKE